jgi:hypothetical protein
MLKTQYLLLSLGLSAALGLGACDNSQPATPTPVDPMPAPVVPPGPDYAFDHDNILGNVGDIFRDGRQVSPAEGERMHACGKIQYATLGRILTDRGVNVNNAANFSAGQLYSSGNLVLGVANFPARVGESDRNTTGGIVRLYDIIIAAAEEILPDAATDRLSTSKACPGAKLYNADNTCNADGFACFLGTPPTSAQLQLCNEMVKDAFDSNILNRKRLAVAAMASPIWLCD